MLPDIQLSEQVVLKQAQLVIELKAGKLDMFIQGRLDVKISQGDRQLSFVTVIDERDGIKLLGNMKGIHQSVLGVRDF